MKTRFCHLQLGSIIPFNRGCKAKISPLPLSKLQHLIHETISDEYFNTSVWFRIHVLRKKSLNLAKNLGRMPVGETACLLHGISCGCPPKWQLYSERMEREAIHEIGTNAGGGDDAHL